MPLICGAGSMQKLPCMRMIANWPNYKKPIIHLQCRGRACPCPKMNHARDNTSGNRPSMPRMDYDEPYRHRATARIAPTKDRSYRTIPISGDRKGCPYTKSIMPNHTNIGRPQGLSLPPAQNESCRTISISGNLKGCPYGNDDLGCLGSITNNLNYRLTFRIN